MTKKSDEILPEITPETTAKKAPEKAPEITSEVAPETTPEVAPEIGLAATLEKAAKKESSVSSFGSDPFQTLFSKFNSETDSGHAVFAMQIDRAGCLVKTSVLLDDSVVQTTTFVPGVRVQDIRENDVIVGRKLVHI